jgi:hypothetical protein
LSCSGAPPGSTCTVPPTVISTGGAITPFDVTVATTARSGAFPIGGTPFLPPGLGAFEDALALMTLLILLELAAKSAAGRTFLPVRRHAWNYAALTLALTGWLIASACGGGQSYVPPPPGGGTPSGTFTVTVTATSGATTQNLPLILNVLR